MTRRGTTGTPEDKNGMSHGVIDGFMGSWGSGLGYLIIDGQPVPCDNAATVRALDACFGGVMAPGHLVSQESIVGREIWYSVGPCGVLESFGPVDDDSPADEKEAPLVMG
jgi:hypothetical protein